MSVSVSLCVEAEIASASASASKSEKKGIRADAAPLTEEDYKKIIALRGSKGAIELGKVFKTSPARIYKIWRGQEVYDPSRFYYKAPSQAPTPRFGGETVSETSEPSASRPPTPPEVSKKSEASTQTEKFKSYEELIEGLRLLKMVINSDFVEAIEDALRS